jgi:hypothetical protein
MSREVVRVDCVGDHSLQKILRVEVDARSRLMENQLWYQSLIFQTKVRNEIRFRTLEGEVREETRMVRLVVSNADFSVEAGSRSIGVKHDDRVDGRPKGRRRGDRCWNDMSMRGEIVLLCVRHELSAWRMFICTWLSEGLQTSHHGG